MAIERHAPHRFEVGGIVRCVGGLLEPIARRQLPADCIDARSKPSRKIEAAPGRHRSAYITTFLPSTSRLAGAILSSLRSSSQAPLGSFFHLGTTFLLLTCQSLLLFLFCNYLTSKTPQSTPHRLIRLCLTLEHHNEAMSSFHEHGRMILSPLFPRAEHLGVDDLTGN